MSELDENIVDEFLVDSHEALDRLDHDLVGLERDPASAPLLKSAFRTLHTIKGTCSFFGFRRLERLTHAGEHLLAKLRSGELAFSETIASTLLAVGDRVRTLLAHIESQRCEPQGEDAALIARLEQVALAAADSAAGAAEASAGDDHDAPLAQQNVRVDVRVLDGLMNHVGELVLARNHLMQLVAAQDWPAVPAAAQRMDAVTSRLQEATTRTRMQPISTLWTRIPRLVRDVASACGKRVVLEMEGTDTELDRTLVEALKDPLTHLVRNAIDHGIEPPSDRIAAGKPANGRLRLRAFHEAGQVHLELSDDGGGLDVVRIRDKAIQRGLVTPEEASRQTDVDWMNCIFLPGFSTAANVTAISGRGVGMDVVRSSIQRVGGTVEVNSERGRGTTLHLRMPLTLAIIPALIVESVGERYAIPQVNLVELVRVSAADLPARIESVQGAPVYRLRGRLLPLVSLTEELHGESSVPLAPRSLVVLRAEGRTFGLLTHGVHDTEEIVVKPLSERLRTRTLFAGATIRGDGRVALILDVSALASRAGLLSEDTHRDTTDTSAAQSPSHASLLVTTLAGHRVALALAGVARIEEFDGGTFERVEDAPAVQYRGTVLSVVALRTPSAALVPLCVQPGRTYPVIVHGEGATRTGFVVDRIDDVIEQQGPVSSGRAVLRGTVVEFVDLDNCVVPRGDARAAA
ncbi:MAG: chemotaxis protein CheA [Candidatus Eisenbacteria bacterium]